MKPHPMYNPALHHRRSIRLQGYDYAQAGLYFVTLCCQNRDCLFGEIVNGDMRLNPAGRCIQKWYAELESKFSDIRCDVHIVMPNHFHCILENTGVMRAGQSSGNPSDSAMDAQTMERGAAELGGRGNVVLGEHVGSPLRRVVQWFKTMTTNEYIRNVKTAHWPPFAGKLWQRNYYEHIIRNEKSYYNIRNYILNNPAKWDSDTLNQHQKNKNR